jgi:hypothetical protein
MGLSDASFDYDLPRIIARSSLKDPYILSASAQEKVGDGRRERDKANHEKGCANLMTLIESKRVDFDRLSIVDNEWTLD